MTILCLLLSLCACHSHDPAPLPPKVQQDPSLKQANGHLVKVGSLKGYLVRPIELKTDEAIIVRLEQGSQNAQAAANKHPGATVFVIETTQDVPTAQKYLEGLDGVGSVRIVCSSPECPDLVP